MTLPSAFFQLFPARRANAPWLALGTLLAFSAQADDIQHPVRTGDTLEQLSRKYLGDGKRWPLLRDHNQVQEPRRLQPGSVVRIPWSAFPESTARVRHVEGVVRLENAAAQPEAVLQPNTTLREGSALELPADSHLSVELADGTVVHVQGPAQVQWKHLREQARTGRSQSQMELHQGRMEAQVPPQPKAPARFEVRTPLGTTSVRGTHFDVQVQPDGKEQTTVLSGQVQSGAQTATLLGAGQGLTRDAQGRTPGVQTLLSAPDLPPLPVQEDAQWIALPLPPLPSGAVAYDVSVRTEGEGAKEHVLRHQVTPSPLVRWTAVSDGQYTVRVRLIDQQGLAGWPAQQAVTVKAHPVAPLSQSPLQDASVPAGPITLTCSDSPEASSYLMELANDAAFRSILHRQESMECSWAQPSLAPATYFWRVASLRETPSAQRDQGPYGVAQSFHVRERPAQPDAQNVQTESDQSLRLRWQGSEDMHYRIQVASDAQFSTLLADEWLQHPQWAPASWPRGQFFARLQQKDAHGIESEFSASWRFTWEGQGIRTGSGAALLLQDQQSVERSPE